MMRRPLGEYPVWFQWLEGLRPEQVGAIGVLVMTVILGLLILVLSALVIFA